MEIRAAAASALILKARENGENPENSLPCSYRSFAGFFSLASKPLIARVCPPPKAPLGTLSTPPSD